MKVLLQNDFSYVGGGQCVGGGNGNGASVNCKATVYENDKKDFNFGVTGSYTGGYDGKGEKKVGGVAEWKWK